MNPVPKLLREYEANQETPLIVQGAQISKKDFTELRRLGADGVLIKPVLLEVLESTVRQCLTYKNTNN